MIRLVSISQHGYSLRFKGSQNNMIPFRYYRTDDFDNYIQSLKRLNHLEARETLNKTIKYYGNTPEVIYKNGDFRRLMRGFELINPSCFRVRDYVKSSENRFITKLLKGTL